MDWILSCNTGYNQYEIENEGMSENIYDMEVISIPASGTIYLIYKYRIHAHPDDIKRYPYKKAIYYTFRKKGGVMEKLYTLYDTVSFNPHNIEEINKFNLNSNDEERILSYIKYRFKEFGFSEEGNYKFYILGSCLDLEKTVSLPKQNNHAYFKISEIYSGKQVISRYKEYTSEEMYIEGAMTTINVNKYERNMKARKKCLEYYGYKCCICGFDFEKFYGHIGKNIIEVHHKKPLNEIRSAYEVNPIEDLRPVCSNCHTIIHSRKPNYEIEELRSIILNKSELFSD